MAGLPTFLVCHGSFNPVHRQHLEMMVQARQQLQAAGFAVVRGIMAITPSKRLKQKGVPSVLDKHRLAALQLGCDAVGQDWLVSEARGVEFGSGHRLVQGLSSELLAEVPNARIFKLVGSDTAVRYPNELKKGPTVVVCREGSTETLRKKIQILDLRFNQNDFFVVSQLPGEECSSTKLRELLLAGDVQAVQRMCPEPVAEYLLAQRDVLYENISEVLPSDGVSRFASGYHAGPVFPAAAATHRGSGITPESLRGRWANIEGEVDVIGFYGHGKKAGEFACFSNFFDQSEAPFNFVIPAVIGCPFAGREVLCDFSETAIMVCKAAVMGDEKMFELMKTAKQPGYVKRLGRRVQRFDKDAWNRIVCSVAFEVVFQKFAKTPRLGEVLLGTGDVLLAEATHNDVNWGIGIDMWDERLRCPAKWDGSNILGWALMEARDALRGVASLTGFGDTGAQSTAAAFADEAAPSVGRDASPANAAQTRRWGKKR
eukprot:TRINITY_DN69816_c0_g1_i1.p1 TRINITY_DN69816_c0_g1~~TRINITY_DN69816_c0_g1_i1.p1  ORF type:complete len:507 (-),score=65.23 TRINITY_DN69816_c0_g1_i1:212-1669(-)